VLLTPYEAAQSQRARACPTRYTSSFIVTSPKNPHETCQPSVANSLLPLRGPTLLNLWHPPSCAWLAASTRSSHPGAGECFSAAAAATSRASSSALHHTMAASVAASSSSKDTSSRVKTVSKQCFDRPLLSALRVTQLNVAYTECCDMQSFEQVTETLRTRTDTAHNHQRRRLPQDQHPQLSHTRRLQQRRRARLKQQYPVAAMLPPETP
jgi:hypothetical protein